MKTNLQKLFLLAIILLTPNRIQAASSCSYSEQAELNSIVANVKATYEVIDIYKGKTLALDQHDENGNIPEVDSYVKGFKISVLNITDDIYVKMSNKNTGEVKTFYYKDTDNGTISFDTEDVFDLNTYTIDVFANKYACIGERFRTLTLSTPVYNSYHSLIACQENPEFYYCQEFLPVNNISMSDFINRMDSYTQAKQEVQEHQQELENNKNFIDKLKDFYNNNKLIIYSIGIVIVVAGVATTVILIKKKRSRVL